MGETVISLRGTESVLVGLRAQKAVKVWMELQRLDGKGRER